MGNDNVLIESQEHAAARKEVETQLEAIAGTIKGLSSDVQNLQGWDGSARGGMNQAAADWAQKATKLNGVLEEIRVALNKADTQLQDQDHHALAPIPSLTNL